MLERVELDRPILLREKFDILWSLDKQASDTKFVKLQIKQYKIARSQANALMADKYNEMLTYIY